jgi:hypothetical protein
MAGKPPYKTTEHNKVTPLLRAVPGNTERCKAVKKVNNEQCKNKPLPGATVCKHHGGNSPQVKRSAQEWIDTVAPQMVGVLEEIAMDVLNEPRDRILAARELLSRTPSVYQPGHTSVQITYNPNEDPVRMELLRQARDAAASAPAKLGKVFEIENVIDAEYTEDQD